MKKITFVIPPHLQFSSYTHPAENAKIVKKKDGKGYGNLITDMPLGPLALSSYLKKHIPGITTKLLDFNVELNALEAFPFQSFKDYFTDYFKNTDEFNDTEIFGISCLFSPSYQSLLDMAQVLKSIYPKAKVMAGGNIPSNMYKELYKMDPSSIDYMCYGEGELPMIGFLKAEDKAAYVKQSNSWVTYEKSIDPTFKPAHDFIFNLDEIPLYDYDLCEDKYNANPAYTAYGGHQDKESNFHILTSRGCPFHCIFCASHKVHGRQMRYYSMERVKEDLRYLKAQGAKTILFQDDHFMGDQKRALEIVKFVGELGFKFIFQNSLALYALKREFLEAAKAAGMNQLVLSVESGSERVLRKVMKKPLNLKIVEQVVKDCRELGIYTYCNIVLGLPGETKEDIEDGRQFLKTIHANWFGIFIANPLVGSEMFDICNENNYLHDNWIGSDYKQAVVSTKDWTAEFIKDKAYQMNLELNIIQNSDYRLGHYEVALDAFERVLRAKEDHAVALMMSSRCLYKLGQQKRAEEYIRRAEDLYKKDEFWKKHMDYFGLNVFDVTYDDGVAGNSDFITKQEIENKHFTNIG